MADSKLSALTAKTSMNSTDELLVNEAGTSKKIDFSDLTETGTFTPTIYGSTTAGTQTYSNQLGYYSRVGKMVQFDIYITLTAKDGTTAGDLRIGGLPYTSGFLSAVSFSFIAEMTLTSSYFMNGYVVNSGTYININETNGTTRNTLTDAALTSSTAFMVSGCYRAA